MQGGYCHRSDTAVVDRIRSFGASFIFSTSLARCWRRARIASVGHLMNSAGRRRLQRERGGEMKARLTATACR